ncbi:MAG: M20/M25/M40 family metallo-hydrolase [Vicinamibacterales bacterium]
MKRFATLTLTSTAAIVALVAAAMSGSIAAQSAERVDTAAIAKIRDEGLNRSQVMDTMFWLTDRYGPRLTGSKEFEEAGDWAVERLKSYGVQNVRKERFEFGNGWSLQKFHATMVEPRVMPIIGAVKAWTPGTNGTFTADVVRPEITNEADAAKYRGQLRGKIVLTQPAREVRMLEYGDGTVLRYDNDNGKWREEALSMPAPRGARGGGEAVRRVAVAAGPGAAGRGGAAECGGAGRGGRGSGFNVNEFYKSEGVLALFDRGSNSDMASGGSDLTWQQQHTDGGTFAVQSGGRASDEPGSGLPQVTLAVEHYNRMVRLLDHDQPVKVELQVETEFRPETQPNGFNILGEIPGTDKADELVIIGAHFDSWQGATGATDNASGSAAMMEALRIIQATGLRPRRTIRIALWGAEEGGLVGSRTYVREHLGTRDEPKPEYAKVSAYFNIDNGTGPIRGIWMQENDAVRPIFAAWIAPLKDLDVTILGPRSVGSTDHASFDSVGVPGFQFVQERYEYNSRTHHTNMDFLDRVQPDDMKLTATVAAVFAWEAANRDQMLPRKPAPAGGGRP